VVVLLLELGQVPREGRVKFKRVWSGPGYAMELPQLLPALIEARGNRSASQAPMWESVRVQMAAPRTGPPLKSADVSAASRHDLAMVRTSLLRFGMGCSCVRGVLVRASNDPFQRVFPENACEGFFVKKQPL